MIIQPVTRLAYTGSDGGWGVTVWIKAADREPVYFKRSDGLRPDRFGQTGWR